MKKIITLCIFVCAFVAISAFAQNKVVVIPLNSSRVPAEALPLAYGYVASSGSLLAGYGVTSCSSPATGVYDCILDQSFQIYPVIVATSYNSVPGAEIVTTGTYLPSNTVRLNVSNGSGTAVNSGLNFIVYGTAQ